jgi:hypothetical protein
VPVAANCPMARCWNKAWIIIKLGPCGFFMTPQGWLRPE